MENLTLLIKPASGLCNLRCRYCFYRDLSGDRAMCQMRPETAHVLIRRALEEASGCVTFQFQGGEPTLAGLDFFRDFTDEVERLRPGGLRVQYGLQTNGLLLDEQWAQFLVQKKFLTGLSLDGAAALHDQNRIDAKGRGSFSRTMAAARQLERAGAPFNVLCVVTGAAARHARQLYTWFRNHSLHNLQLIPCLEPLDAEPGSTPYFLPPQRYGRFLRELFDLYYTDWKNGCYVSIQLFDDFVHMLAGQTARTCAASGQCGSYLVVEHDGSCYPCDFYVQPEWLLGNIHAESLMHMQQSEVARLFLHRRRRSEQCAACDFASLCGGGCPRYCQRPDEMGIYCFCAAYRDFFTAELPRLREMALAERRAAQFWPGA